ncbi:unnamed protein product, partial [Trichogramma brassicae]
MSDSDVSEFGEGAARSSQARFRSRRQIDRQSRSAIVIFLVINKKIIKNEGSSRKRDEVRIQGNKARTTSTYDTSPGRQLFVKFIASTGYKYEPEVDENGSPVTRRTTPIHHAAKYKCYQLMDHLFKIYNRFDVNYIDESGYTHFHVACQSDCDDVVTKFLDFGQDPNCICRETGDTPLHLALKFGWKKIVKILLKRDANPFVTNKAGFTPLHISCMDLHNALGLTKMLFELSNVKYDSMHVNVQDYWGRTPLHYALSCSHEILEIFRLLLENGANANLADEEGWTPLHYICKKDNFYYEDWKIFFKINEDHNQTVDVNVRDKKGQTPLHYASERRIAEFVEILLENGANPNLANAEGLTPLHLICDKHNFFHDSNDDIMELFFKINDERHQTVEVNAVNNSGQTPLHLALGCEDINSKKVVELLLRRGADPNAANAKGSTPLHLMFFREELLPSSRRAADRPETRRPKILLLLLLQARIRMNRTHEAYCVYVYVLRLCESRNEYAHIATRWEIRPRYCSNSSRATSRDLVYVHPRDLWLVYGNEWRCEVLLNSISKKTQNTYSIHHSDLTSIRCHRKLDWNSSNQWWQARRVWYDHVPSLCVYLGYFSFQMICDKSHIRRVCSDYVLHLCDAQEWTLALYAAYITTAAPRPRERREAETNEMVNELCQKKKKKKIKN